MPDHQLEQEEATVSFTFSNSSGTVDSSSVEEQSTGDGAGMHLTVCSSNSLEHPASAKLSAPANVPSWPPSR